MSGFLFAGTLIGCVVSIGLFVIEMDMRKNGKVWYEGISKKFTLNDEFETVYYNESEKYIYKFDKRPHGYYQLTKKNGKWFVECSWNSKTKPYLTYQYDTNTKEISNFTYEKKRLKGWDGYMSLANEKIIEVINIILKEINRKIIEIDNGKNIKKNEEKNAIKNHIMEIRQDDFKWIEKPNRLVIEMNDSTIYEWKETSHFLYQSCTQNGKEIYSLTKKKKNDEIVSFDIEENQLKDIKDIDAYAKEQQLVWLEFQKAIQRQYEKKEQLVEKWVTQQPKKQNDSWEQFEESLQNRIEKEITPIIGLNEEQKWYLKTTLPKRLKETRVLRKNGSITDEQTNEIIHNIQRKLYEIEETVAKCKEKEGERIVLLTQVD